MAAPASSAASATAQRKAMRKGTRSCFECRRRKVRCIFEASDSTACVGCTSRGSQCIEQRRELLQTAAVDSRQNLKSRVAKLETILQSLAPGVGTGEFSTPQAKNSQGEPQSTLPSSREIAPVYTNSTNDVVDTMTSLSIPSKTVSSTFGPDTSQSLDPIASLFNNAIWQSEKESGNSKGPVGRLSRKPDPKLAAKRLRTRETLLSGILPWELTRSILDETSSWWHTWRSLGQWQIGSSPKKNSNTLLEFVISAFHSEDPSVVGLALLSVSVSIKQLHNDSHQQIVCQLPRSAEVLFKEYFELVETLIVNDSDYASTREGIEVIIMSGKMLMNFGLIKKAWILSRRAISYCQLLGLHRPLALFENESDTERHQRHCAWVSICESDTYLSLLLGLPNASDCKSIPATIFGELGTVSSFRRELLKLSVKIIDMHQIGMSLSTEDAHRIQLEIESSARSMPSDFWNCQSALTTGNISMTEYMESITSHLWYHQLKVSLHMPLMIKSVDAEKLESHRLYCLEASRDLLRTYHIMRLDNSGAFDMIKLIDYQAFICATLLVLGILGYGTLPSPKHSRQQSQDRGLVDTTLQVLRQTVATADNHIASQALQGLETMSVLTKWDGHRRLAGGKCATPLVSIVVPYSGTILISPGTFLTKQADSRQALTNPHLVPLPVFTLSNGAIQYGSDQAQYNLLPEAPDNLVASSDQENGNDMALGFPSIDLGWGNLTNMNISDDWAWMNDLNSMNGFMSF